MPQLFQVLRCYKCLVFQIHQTKKSNKWQCKMCGEKQSMKRHYGVGNGKECRLHVQKLNGLRGEKDEMLNNLDSDNDNSNSEEENVNSNVVQNEINNQSKWVMYMENDEVEQHQNNSPMCLGNNEVCLETPSKQMKLEKRKKVSHLKKENTTKSFKTPYKCQSEEITPAYKLVEPVKNAMDNICNATKDVTNSHKAVSVQGFEKKAVEKNSKWSKFVESDDLEENESPAQNSLINTKELFQLCDNTDLDDVLNI